MRAPEDHRPLTGARMGAWLAPIRAARFLMAAAVFAGACADSGAVEGLRPTETVIGRARWRGQLVMLTDAPALVRFDPDRMRLLRTPLRSTAASSALWGLAEAGGRLFSISRFDRLIEIREEGAIVEIAPLDRPLANLIDVEGGMAAQLAGDQPEGPLTIGLDEAGRASGHDTLRRTSLGVTQVEQSLLSLLSCSVPPRAVCWLPATPQILEWRGAALRPGPLLSGVPEVPPGTLVAALEQRVIEDVLVDAGGGYLVLRVVSGTQQRLSWFTPDGRPGPDVTSDEPLRLLVALLDNQIVVVTRSGRLLALAR